MSQPTGTTQSSSKNSATTTAQESAATASSDGAISSFTTSTNPSASEAVEQTSLEDAALAERDMSRDDRTDHNAQSLLQNASLTGNTSKAPQRVPQEIVIETSTTPQPVPIFGRQRDIIANETSSNTTQAQDASTIASSTRVTLDVAMADTGMAPECPECAGMMSFQEGCMMCHSCGFSKCG